MCHCINSNGRIELSLEAINFEENLHNITSCTHAELGTLPSTVVHTWTSLACSQIRIRIQNATCPIDQHRQASLAQHLTRTRHESRTWRDAKTPPPPCGTGDDSYQEQCAKACTRSHGASNGGAEENVGVGPVDSLR